MEKNEIKNNSENEPKESVVEEDSEDSEDEDENVQIIDNFNDPNILNEEINKNEKNESNKNKDNDNDIIDNKINILNQNQNLNQNLKEKNQDIKYIQEKNESFQIITQKNQELILEKNYSEISYNSNIYSNNLNILNEEKFEQIPYDLNFLYGEYECNKLMQNKFRNKISFPLPPLEEIILKATELCKQNKGSSLIEFHYCVGNDIIRNKIFESLKKDIFELSKDFFGNYVIQFIIEFREERKINEIFLEFLKRGIIELCYKAYSVRVVQKLIDVISINNIIIILDELVNEIKELITDKNGTFVIQKIINKLEGKQLSIIYEIIKDNLDIYLNDKNGSHIVEKILHKISENQRNKIIEEIYEKDIENLCKDKYGNYILLEIIEYKINLDKFYNKIKGKIFELAKDKFSTHIIQKIYEYGNDEIKKDIINEIIKLYDEDKKNFNDLITDKYGNYFIKKIIEYRPLYNQNEFIKRINDYFENNPKKKKEPYSKYVYNILDKY